MEISQYILKKTEIQKSILQYLEEDEEESDQENYNNLFINLKDPIIIKNPNEFKITLYLISKISDNHQRTPHFIKKIEQILEIIKEEIKQTFSNSDIYEIFKNNKRILLFLFKASIIIPSKSIADELVKSDQMNYFYPEFKDFIDKEKVTEIENTLIDLIEFNQKREIGENDAFICELIRNDSIENFVSYVNKTNFSLTSKINYSIFETNSMLLKYRETSLIEYAAFFGSIQIFQYLRINNVSLRPFLLIFAIHGRNADLIHLLEESHFDISYQDCLDESLKCHHFEITEYFINNFIDKKSNSFSKSAKFFNFYFFPKNLNEPKIFYYLCKYNFIELVDKIIQLKDRKKNLIIGILKKKKKLNEVIQKNSMVYFFFFSYKTALQIAIERGNTEIVELLMKNKKLMQEAFKMKTFYECKKLTKITVPSYITSIGESTFYECSSLSQITIPSKISIIKQFAFQGCSSLTEIAVPSSLKILSESAFKNCSSLKQIILPSSLKSIGNYAFCECSSLNKIKIPSSVISIGEFCFQNCFSLNFVSFEKPCSLPLLKSSVFESCTSLVEVSIPSSVTKIETCAFQNCISLKKISFDLPSSLVSIYPLVFCQCSSLEEINIPSPVNSIGYAAFKDCISLNKVVIPSSVTRIMVDAFQNCTSLKKIITGVSLNDFIIKIDNNVEIINI